MGKQLEKREKIQIPPTPTYKIVFTFSILFFIFFGILTAISIHRNSLLEKNYKNLLTDNSYTFATLSEYHPLESSDRKKHIYTYLVPDESGKLNEVVEMVDPIVQKKLRVGDTVMIRKRLIHFYGKDIVIARIENNIEKISISKVPEYLGLSGLGVGFIFLLIGVIAKFLKL